MAHPEPGSINAVFATLDGISVQGGHCRKLCTIWDLRAMSGFSACGTEVFLET